MDEAALRAMLPACPKPAGSAQMPVSVHDEDGDYADDDEFEDDEEEDEPSQPTLMDKSSDVAPEPSSASSHLADYANVPLTQSLVLQGHTKTVSALGIDPSGARLATGSHDYFVKMYDFGGMTTSLRAFKSFEPAESYPVVQLAFSPYSKNLLCLCASTQARVYDYDGNEIALYKKGDIFMRDMRHTTGHISDITCGGWHPLDDQVFYTGGSDSTVRLWDMHHKASQTAVIVVRSKERGTKTKVTAATFAPDAQSILASGQDGALYVWSTTGNLARPSLTVPQAHAPGQGATSLAMSQCGTKLASRGADDTLKLWDVRQLRTPLHVRDDLPNDNDHTDVLFSPDGQQLLTGTAAVAQGSDSPTDLHSQWGQLVVLSASDLHTELVHPVARTSVHRLAWHPRLNQVFTSTRGGDVHIYYDAEASQLGAKLALRKRARDRTNHYAADPSTTDPYADVPIVVPEEEEDDYFDPVYKKPQFPRDPRNSRVPERPLEGRGKNGRIGRSALQPLVAELWEGDLRAEDPREALLKYADKAQKDPRFTSVYAKTQPKTIFAKEDPPNETQ
ncbi:hypothetical protein MNAN1_000200 [Malassezia nana]|uniref:WD repeat-containing protein 70 n=1 Tax=Malassezia nana TaxID=180528 RepID=A0AAF0EJ08_9BASI|nr:hypothetical protein MNAN1_000200 [Malassezia nana]